MVAVNINDISYVYNPHYTSVLITNNIPSCKGNASIAHRLQFLPFDTIFTDNPLLQNEKHNINNVTKIIQNNTDALDFLFTWLVNGAIKSITSKPEIPEKVIQQKLNYLTEEGL